MNDQASWEQALAAAANSYASLPPGTAAELNLLIDDIMRLKQNLVELALAAGSSQICRTCGGECCRYGKYHVSVLDRLAYLKTDSEQAAPDFSTNPACPYSDVSGCTMAPSYRPMTCVVFNCQEVEEQFTSAQRETAQGYEKALRAAIARASRITGTRLDRALLLSCS